MHTDQETYKVNKSHLLEYDLYGLKIQNIYSTTNAFHYTASASLVNMGKLLKILNDSFPIIGVRSQTSNFETDSLNFGKMVVIGSVNYNNNFSKMNCIIMNHALIYKTNFLDFSIFFRPSLVHRIVIHRIITFH